MALNFDNKIPGWKNEGAEPSADLKEKGFVGGYKPPATVFNWFWSLVAKCINELQTKLKSHADNTSNPHGVTKAQVGLGNVNDTSDAAKNVLSATKLTTARKINGVSFNGTADITVSANPKQNSLTDESLNDVIDFGFYFAAGGNTVTDFPPAASTNGTTVGGFSLVVAQAGGAGRLQIYASSIGMWFRVGSISGTTANWNGWIKVYNSASPVKINGVVFNGTADITVLAKLTRFNCNENIADGLDVYSISSPSTEMVLNVDKNYSIGDSFGIVFSTDYTNSSDSHIELLFNETAIHNGVLDDANNIAITSFEGGVLYKVVLKANGYTCEKSEASTVATIETDRTLNANDVFFLDFSYTSGTVNTGIGLQTVYNGIMSTAMYIYDTNNKKVTAVETNRMYLFKKKSNGFYMMKIG